LLASYTIKDAGLPSKKNLESDIEWIARSLGLIGARDKEKSAMKIFRMLVETAREGGKLRSDGISSFVRLSRGTVVSHLNHMMTCGLAVRRENRYELRVRSMERTIDEIEKDICRVLRNIKEIARDVDERLDLRYRE
jgi:predicted transcriptional regulator